MAQKPKTKTATTGISASALAKATEQAMQAALQQCCELLRDDKLDAKTLTTLLKTLDSIRFSLRWQDKVLRRAEQSAQALLGKSLPPKGAKEITSKLKETERDLKNFGRSAALLEFDKNIGITPGEEPEPGAEEEVA